MADKTIVVVDDQITNLTMMRDILSGQYTVFCVEDSRTALAVIAQHSPDLVIMDLMLNHGIVGSELVEALRKTPGFTARILGSSSEQGATADAFYALCDAHLSKPFTVEQLRKSVKPLLA